MQFFSCQACSNSLTSERREAASLPKKASLALVAWDSSHKHQAKRSHPKKSEKYTFIGNIHSMHKEDRSSSANL